ncbi:MAG: DUF3987 domain-containing protein [Planctomycetia bacterium]|nr:DUF3987 domain-containing protein [Planctomycetia bacterium]
MSITHETKQNNGLKDAALNYALRQWQVVPIYTFTGGRCSCPKGARCTSPGKHPMTKHGLEEATTNSAQLNKWWTNAPQANVALRTGAVSGFWVLDADGAQGVEAVKQLEAVFGPLPTTPTVRTGGGGIHYYFKVTADVTINNTTKLGDQPVDVRGEGGYVLAPPSNHASGKGYVWELSPNHAPLAVAPAWLTDVVTKKTSWPVTAASVVQAPVVPSAPTSVPKPMLMPSAERRTVRVQEDLDLTTASGAQEGSRHNRLLRLIGHHLGRGEPRDEVRSMALAFNADCKPPTDEAEVNRIVDDLADKQEAADKLSDHWEPPVPFHEFELPPFPTAALSPWLRSYVEAVATATQTPADMVAMLVLSTLAAAVAKKVEVVVKEGYREPLNLFTVTAMPPGSRKSAVYADVTAPLLEYEASEIRRLTPIIEEEKTRLEIQQKHHAKMKDEVLKAKPEEYDMLLRQAVTTAGTLATVSVPALPRLVASDTTPERLATLLQEQEGRMAVMSPEGDVFDLMAGRYGTKGAANFGVYLNGHAGDDLRVDRVNRPAEFVKRPALTLGLVVQPDVIHGLADKPGFRGRGLLGRFLYAMPRSLVGRRCVDPPSVPASVRDHYQAKLLSLLRLECLRNEHREQQPYCLQLTAEARQVLFDLAHWIEPLLAEAGDLGCIADWAGKLVGAVVRIAGLLHMAEHVDAQTPWTIALQKETMDRAVEIGKYLIPHARAAFAQMGADPVIEDAKFVWSWVTRKGLAEASERDIYEGTKGRFRRMELLRPVLLVLVNHGYLRPKMVRQPRGPGRRPSPCYEVNPYQPTQDAQCVQPGFLAADNANSGNNASALAPSANGGTMSLADQPPMDSANSGNNASGLAKPGLDDVAVVEQPVVDSANSGNIASAFASAKPAAA